MYCCPKANKLLIKVPLTQINIHTYNNRNVDYFLLYDFKKINLEQR